MIRRDRPIRPALPGDDRPPREAGLGEDRRLLGLPPSRSSSAAVTTIVRQSNY